MFVYSVIMPGAGCIHYKIRLFIMNIVFFGNCQILYTLLYVPQWLNPWCASLVALVWLPVCLLQSQLLQRKTCSCHLPHFKHKFFKSWKIKSMMNNQLNKIILTITQQEALLLVFNDRMEWIKIYITWWNTKLLKQQAKAQLNKKQLTKGATFVILF